MGYFLISTMPKSPEHIRPYWIPKPEPKKFGGRNTKFYKSNRWIAHRLNYIKTKAFGLCEVDKYLDKNTDCTGRWEGYLDHIIAINAGGSEMDERNHMWMKKYWHNVKRGMEKHNPILIEAIENEDGDLIPKNREDILKILTKKEND
jgi:hypothetical protein